MTPIQSSALFLPAIMVLAWACGDSGPPTKKTGPVKASDTFKPRTPIDFFCEGFARASAHGVRDSNILASTAHFATKMGGPAIANNAKKWVEMTEDGLLREIQKDGNPRICRRFAAFLKRTDMLAKRVQKRRAQEGKAQIPTKPDKPCDALKTCCDAIPSTTSALRDKCFRSLQAAKDVQQTAWCKQALKDFRLACTGSK